MKRGSRSNPRQADPTPTAGTVGLLLWENLTPFTLVIENLQFKHQKLVCLSFCHLLEQQEFLGGNLGSKLKFPLDLSLRPSLPKSLLSLADFRGCANTQHLKAESSGKCRNSRDHMAKALIGGLRRLSISSLLKSSCPISPHFSFRPNLEIPGRTFSVIFRPCMQLTPRCSWWGLRNFSHGRVNLVISPQGKPKFETYEIEQPKKEKWMTKKRLKMQRKKEKQKRKAANKRDPRRLGVKGKKRKQRFANAEERIKYKLERAKLKEALLIERLKRYEVNKVQGPVVKPHELTGEERFYMKKMAQKRSNYVPIGRRGVFGGVILNMHLHWKKHETVKVICQPCKPGQLKEYANEISRLSGGIPIQIIGDDTIIFYRGKDYVQPEVMSPIDTLSKKRALEKSKYEQSLESIRRFIAIAEKELELYYRHVALYGDSNDRNPNSIFDKPRRIEWHRNIEVVKEGAASTTEDSSQNLFQTEPEIMDDEEVSEFDGKYSDNEESASEIDYEDNVILISELESCDEETSSSTTRILSSTSVHQSKWKADN